MVKGTIISEYQKMAGFTDKWICDEPIVDSFQLA
jgi:hypothetical protein